MGLTDKVLSEIEARQKKNRSYSTPLYQKISVMKEFRMTPSEWNSLARVDRKILTYHRIMEGHYIDEMEEKMNRDMEREKEKQKLMTKMPKQKLPRRR